MIRGVISSMFQLPMTFYAIIYLTYIVRFGLFTIGRSGRVCSEIGE